MDAHSVAITIQSFDLQGPAMAALRGCCRVVYTNTTGRRLTEEELIAALREADVAISGTEPYTSRVIDAAPRLRIISRVGSGTDSLDLKAAGRKGIRVFTTPDAPVQAVAEHTLALLLAVLKQIPQYSDGLRRGITTRRNGRLLSGKEVGIVGLGRIGTRVAAMLESLGCRIQYFDPFTPEPAGRAWLRKATLPELAAGVDILSLHAAAQEGQRPLVDAAVLGSCRRGIIIINSARGSLIDEEAMISALEDGTIAGAGLDVFRKEPYTGPMLSYPQVVVTPHVASSTGETRALMEHEAIRQIIEALEDGV